MQRMVPTDWRMYMLAGAVVLIGIHYVAPFLLYLGFAVLAFLLGAGLAIVQGKFQMRRTETYPPPPSLRVEGVLSRVKVYPPPTLRPTLLSANVDAHIQDVIDLILKHHVIPTYQLVGSDHEAFFRSVMPQIWTSLAALIERVGQIDTMKVISQNTVESLKSHFENFRGFQFRDPHTPSKFPNLQLFPYLETPERELNFLRQACEVILCISLPKDLLECTPIRVLIREYLTCHILQPAINYVCDPDYVNRVMLTHLTDKEDATKSAQKKYSYSATYEEFMKHIKKCEEVGELHQIRQFIITEIIQAKAVHKMKTSRATGIHGGHFPIPIPADKAKSLMDRDLELYITQLGTAKTCCERQFRKIGSHDYQADVSPTKLTDSQSYDLLPGIPLDTILRSESAQAQFLQFLQDCSFAHLLHFWMVVENLKSSPTHTIHVRVKSIYDEFLGPAASDPLYADPDLVKQVEKYLSYEASACVDVLQQIQQAVYDDLHDHFYESFILSEHYKELMQTGLDGSEVLAKLSDCQATASITDDDSRYQQRLKSLRIQLEENDDALSAMPDEIRSSSLAQRRKALVKDRYFLQEEIKKLEHYIDHTEEWFGTIGLWSIEIHSVDLSREENYYRDPLFVIVVHRPDAPMRKPESTSSQSGSFSAASATPAPPPPVLEKQESRSESEDGTVSEASEVDDLEVSMSRAGWVVGRQLSEFEELQSKLLPVCPELQFPPLPKWLNPFHRPNASSRYWSKYKDALQSYLCRILKDAKLQECEEVFNFLSPASAQLRKSSMLPPEKAKLHFSFPVFSKDRDDGKEDSVAEHMYLLVSEIFELDEWSKVLRKQLVELVQLTYGKSLDRELQEFLAWVVSEPKLVTYLEAFRDALWPNGKPASPAPTRSDEEKAHTKEEAKKKLLKNTPQALQTVLGQRTTQIGYQKIFEALQDPKANKQLFYSLFEILLFALVPELESVEIEE